jgi:hypothetical protein
MTPGHFISRCEALYGAGWQSKLARDLVRDIRTIRRWKSGESPVPKVVVEWLEKRQAETNRKERCND